MSEHGGAIVNIIADMWCRVTARRLIRAALGDR